MPNEYLDVAVKRCEICKMYLVPEWDGDEKTTQCGYCRSGSKSPSKQDRLVFRTSDVSPDEDFVKEVGERIAWDDAWENAWENAWEMLNNDLQTVLKLIEPPYRKEWFSQMKLIAVYNAGNTADAYGDFLDVDTTNLKWLHHLSGWSREFPDNFSIWYCGNHLEVRYGSKIASIYPSLFVAKQIRDKAKPLSLKCAKWLGCDGMANKDKPASDPVVWEHPEDIYYDIREFMDRFDYEPVPYFAELRSMWKAITIYF